MQDADLNPPPVIEETQEVQRAVSRRLAFAAWNKLKGDEDPNAENLAPETQKRLEAFAREVRNDVLDQVASAVKRYYDKINQSATSILLEMKE